MRCSAGVVLAATCFFVFSLRGWCAGPSPVRMPGPGEGYQITKNETSHPAPAGFEGRTDIFSQTAVGNTPSTAGKRVVGNFKLGNQIRTCPQADGTAEGEGEFSISLDSTDAQANGTNTTHIEMRAKAKYKGQVGDNGYLEGPVNAEIDYSYKLTGSIRGANGAIATPAGSDVQQRITIPVVVGKVLEPPSFGAFTGGDPTKGRYAEAFSVGAALAYWAGVYYSVAQTKWMQGQCAQIVFDPPSNTVQPTLGAQITVKAEVKTKGGQSAKGNFQNARARSGSVNPPGGPSDVESPIKFIYKAPDQKAGGGGFLVNAVSRAGAAEGEWNASLGTGWSGQIICTRTVDGDKGHSELQDWSSSDVQRLTVDVKNGVGTATGYAEMHNVIVNRRKRFRRDGSIETVFDNSTTSEGVVEGTSPANVEVYLNEPNKTYSIDMQMARTIEGKRHTVDCARNNCQESDWPLSVSRAVCLPTALRGRFDDPNELKGSATLQPPGNAKGATFVTTWHLSRRGSGE